MVIFRYQYVFLLLPLLINGESDSESNTAIENTTHSCPFTRIIEDIFRIQKKYSERTLKDGESEKFMLSTIKNYTAYNNTHISIQDELINDIIASINRIKNNISLQIDSNETRLNEAIILKVPENNSKDNNNATKTEHEIKHNRNSTHIKSGIEDKLDYESLKSSQREAEEQKLDIKEISNAKNTTNKTDYAEILTIEPNNTSHISQHNIIEVLKHLMPMFNGSTNKELHSVTIVERNHSKNHSISETKNVSTIVVKYCDKGNLTAANLTIDMDKINVTNTENAGEDYVDANKELPITDQENIEDDYYSDKDSSDYSEEQADLNVNSTTNKKKDVLEAAEYGMQKMHELYSVLEPKLYSMGIWLDDTNPARYVAAFNAPSEDIARYSRYGYATLQAATKLKELNR
ncbi:unnamed protein product [Parnassius mnemosyne]|uniref:Uncharacterized protein n=1 Tax=Parnassius mnemosyne TaxID=213953 RepID=A0AAV1LN79_9NEOP